MQEVLSEKTKLIEWINRPDGEEEDEKVGDSQAGQSRVILR